MCSETQEMEFHTMKRKALQALCKKHNLPANKTNLEMADALTSLLKAEEKPLKVSGEIATVNDSKIVGKQPKKVRFCLDEENIEFVDQEKNPDGKKSRRRSMIVPNVEKSDLNCKRTVAFDDSLKVQQITLRMTRSCAAKSIEGEAAIVHSPIVEKTKRPPVESLTDDVEVAEKADVVEKRIATRRSRHNASKHESCNMDLGDEIIVQKEGKSVFKLEEPLRKPGRQASKRKSIAPINGVMETDDTTGRNKFRKQSGEPIAEETISVTDAASMVQEDSERNFQVKEKTLRKSGCGASKRKSVAPTNVVPETDVTIGRNKFSKQSGEPISEETISVTEDVVMFQEDSKRISQIKEQTLRRSRRNASKGESILPNENMGTGKPLERTESWMQLKDLALEEQPLRRSRRNACKDETTASTIGMEGNGETVDIAKAQRKKCEPILENEGSTMEIGYLPELPRRSRRNASSTGMLGFEEMVGRRESHKCLKVPVVEENEVAPFSEMGGNFQSEFLKTSRRNVSRAESIVPDTGLGGSEEMFQRKQPHKRFKNLVVEASAPKTEMGENFLPELPRRSRRNAFKAESLVPNPEMKEPHTNLKEPVLEEDASALKTKMDETLSVLNKESSVKSSDESKPRVQKYRGRKRRKAASKHAGEKLDIPASSYEPVLSCIKEVPDEVYDEVESRSRVLMADQSVTYSKREIKGFLKVDMQEIVVLEDASDLVPKVINSQADGISPIQHSNYLDKGVSTIQHTDPRDDIVADKEISEDNSSSKTICNSIIDQEEIYEENRVSSEIREGASVVLNESCALETSVTWQVSAEDDQVSALVKDNMEEVVGGNPVTLVESGNERTEELVDDKEHTEPRDDIVADKEISEDNSPSKNTCESVPDEEEVYEENRVSSEICEAASVVLNESCALETAGTWQVSAEEDQGSALAKNSIEEVAAGGNPVTLVESGNEKTEELVDDKENTASYLSKFDELVEITPLMPKDTSEPHRVISVDSLVEENSVLQQSHEIGQADPFPFMDMDPLLLIELKDTKGSVRRVAEDEFCVKGADSMFMCKEYQEVVKAREMRICSLEELDEASSATETIQSVPENLESGDFEENIEVVAKLDVRKERCESKYSEIVVEGEGKEFLETKAANFYCKFSDEIEEKAEIMEALDEEFERVNGEESTCLIPKESPKFPRTSKMSEDHSPLVSQDYSPSNLEDEANKLTAEQNCVCENETDFVEIENARHLQQVNVKELAELKTDGFLDMSGYVNAILEEHFCNDDKVPEENAAIGANFGCKVSRNTAEEVESAGASIQISLVEPVDFEDIKVNSGHLKQVIPEELANLKKVAFFGVNDCLDAVLEEHICTNDKLSGENTTMEVNFDCKGSWNLDEEVENSGVSTQFSLMGHSDHEDHKVSGCVNAILEEHNCKEDKLLQNTTMEANFDCRDSGYLAEEVDNAGTSPQISLAETGHTVKVAEEKFGASTLREPLFDCAEAKEENSNGQTTEKNSAYLYAKEIQEGNAGYYVGENGVFNSNKRAEPVEPLVEASEEVPHNVIFEADDLLPIQKLKHPDYPIDGCTSDKEFEDYNGFACKEEVAKFVEADGFSNTIIEPVHDHVEECEENEASNEIREVDLQELGERCVLDSGGCIDTCQVILEGYEATTKNAAEMHEEVAVARKIVTFEEEFGYTNCEVVNEKEYAEEYLSKFEDMLVEAPPQKPKDSSEPHQTLATSSEYEAEVAVEEKERMELVVCSKDPEDTVVENENSGRDNPEFGRCFEEILILQQTHEIGQADSLPFKDISAPSFVEVQASQDSPPAAVKHKSHVNYTYLVFGCNESLEVVGTRDTVEIIPSAHGNLEHGELEDKVEVMTQLALETDLKCFTEVSEVKGQDKIIGENVEVRENMCEYKHNEVGEGLEKGCVEKMEEKLVVKACGAVQEMKENVEAFVEEISGEDGEKAASVIPSQAPKISQIRKMREDQPISPSTSHVDNSRNVLEAANITNVEENCVVEHIKDYVQGENAWSLPLLASEELGYHRDGAVSVLNCHVYAVLNEHICEDEKLSKEKAAKGGCLDCDSMDMVMEKVHNGDYKDKDPEENSNGDAIKEHFSYVDAKDIIEESNSLHPSQLSPKQLDDHIDNKEVGEEANNGCFTALQEFICGADEDLEQKSEVAKVEENAGTLKHVAPEKLDDHEDRMEENIAEFNGSYDAVQDDPICGNDEALEQKSEVADQKAEAAKVEENVGTLKQLALEKLENHDDYMVEKAAKANGSDNAIIDESICEEYEGDKDNSDVEIKYLSKIGNFAEFSPSQTEMGSNHFAVSQVNASMYQEELGNHEDHMVEKVAKSNGSDDAVLDMPIHEDYEAEEDKLYVEINYVPEIENFDESSSKPEMVSNCFAVSWVNKSLHHEGPGYHEDHMVEKIAEANGSNDAVLDEACEAYEAEGNHCVEINKFTEVENFAEVFPSKTEMGSNCFALSRMKASVHHEELGNHKDDLVEKAAEANRSCDAVLDEPICEDYADEKGNTYVKINNLIEDETFAEVSPSKMEMDSNHLAMSLVNVSTNEGNGEPKFDTVAYEFSSSEFNLLSGDNIGEEDKSLVSKKNDTEVAEAEQISEAGSEVVTFTDTNDRTGFSLTSIDLADDKSHELEFQGFYGNTDLFLLPAHLSEDKGNGLQMKSKTNSNDNQEDGNILSSPSFPFNVEEIEVHQSMPESVGKQGVEATMDEINSLLTNMFISSAVKRKCFSTSMTQSTPKKSFECLKHVGLPEFEMKENTFSVKREQSVNHPMGKSVTKRRALGDLQNNTKKENVNDFSS